MKVTVLLATFLMLSVFASESRAAQFGALAAKTVVAMAGAPGDKVRRSLIREASSGQRIVEKWEISLTNGANHGSAVYEVEIEKKTAGAEEGEEIASVKVNYLLGS